jgi:N-acyl homoserine lactone hydrolase
MLRLAHSGTVILSGDLYHSRANRAARAVPGFNFSRADTLASMDRIEHLLRNTAGRLIIQHDPEDIAELPKAPAFLD